MIRSADRHRIVCKLETEDRILQLCYNITTPQTCLHRQGLTQASDNEKESLWVFLVSGDTGYSLL